MLCGELSDEFGFLLGPLDSRGRRWGQTRLGVMGDEVATMRGSRRGSFCGRTLHRNEAGPRGSSGSCL